MSLDPLALKYSQIEKYINRLHSEKMNEQLFSVNFLGDTIGIGMDTGLEKKAIDALLRVSLMEKDRRVKKAAEKALKEIKKRIT